MSDQNVQKFEEIRRLFKLLSDEMCYTVESYYIWRTLTFAISVPEVGQEQAEKNLKILNRYNDFFTATKHSHFKTFVLGLMKFFDPDDRAVSLDKLIEEIDGNKDKFTLDVVKSVFPELAKRNLIPDDYVAIDQETVDKVNATKAIYASIIGTLKNVRDQQIAHTDIQKIETSVTAIDIEKLIVAIQEMFNAISAKFDLSSTHWGHLKDEATGSTKYLLEDLEKGDLKRREEMGY